MTEHEAFETRLRSALGRYVADGPTGFDALEFARAVAVAEPRRAGRLARLHWPSVMVPRLAWLLVATALLLAALVASALLIGSRPSPQPSLWQWITLPTPDGDPAVLVDVVPAENGYVAIGNSRTGGLVWTSRDGLGWELMPTGSTFAGAEPHALVRTGDGYVAVGADRGRAAAWRSDDGRTWRPVTSVSDAESARMDDIAFANGRYVAVGQKQVYDGYFPFESRAWVSDDAERWEPVAYFAPPDSAQPLVGVAAGGPGFVTASPALVWSSTDGEVWTLAGREPSWSLPDTVLEWQPRDVVAGGVGRVIVAGANGVVHVSDDGAAWTEYQLPTDPSNTVYSVTGLTATTSGYAALSTHTGSGEKLMWTSGDGATWIQRAMGVAAPDTFAGASQPPFLIGCGEVVIVSDYSSTWALPGAIASRGASS